MFDSVASLSERTCFLLNCQKTFFLYCVPFSSLSFLLYLGSSFHSSLVFSGPFSSPILSSPSLPLQLLASPISLLLRPRTESESEQSRGGGGGGRGGGGGVSSRAAVERQAKVGEMMMTRILSFHRFSSRFLYAFGFYGENIHLHLSVLILIFILVISIFLILIYILSSSVCTIQSFLFFSLLFHYRLNVVY